MQKTRGVQAPPRRGDLQRVQPTTPTRRRSSPAQKGRLPGARTVTRQGTRAVHSPDACSGHRGAAGRGRRCRSTTLPARKSGSRCSLPITDHGESSTAAGPCALHRSSAAPGNTFWTLVPARVFTGAQVVESKRAHGAGVQVVARRNAGTPQACHIALHGHKWPRGALLVAIYRTRRAALSAVVDLVDLEGSGGPLWTFLWRSTAG